MNGLTNAALPLKRNYQKLNHNVFVDEMTPHVLYQLQRGGTSRLQMYDTDIDSTVTLGVQTFKPKLRIPNTLQAVGNTQRCESQ